MKRCAKPFAKHLKKHGSWLRIKQVNAAFAHDLRTPLTVLQGNLELLTMADKDEPPDQALLAEMHQQLDRMTAFIQTMSHLSALQNRQLTGEAMTP
ncbi:two component sensor transduction histidine kinase, partial [Lacticaseibacillus rhamnosus MTCC 5462]